MLKVNIKIWMNSNILQAKKKKNRFEVIKN